MTKVPMTARGAERLREELTRLKNVERPRISAAIGEARAHGDLKENAEYHAAKEQQGLVEARIRDLEYKLSHVDIIDVASINAAGRVVFGATVELFSEADDAELRYQIVGEEEADIRDGRISIASPIARALIGKNEGDEVSVQAPGGDRVYVILKVEYI
ncbi:transcription elongation factor GreA [Thioalkalivibrio sp. XN279]|uniref:transcription elongation factor GreA n=1 Tax=Thioalkalivibrio sp. XN279 TaxID=2714953 RepID=UPI001407D6F6|nr:transcription elongation factor GreA [Thioalkalivibrio sp. XN279]NHA14575.1 transcription elongation factor GreA [Thioalkalivibrio sp. XN279]